MSKPTKSEVDTILEHEFSTEFIELMKNRMAMSFFKYGPVRRNFPGKVDALRSMTMRINKYRSTRNTEFLVDAANFLMIEFMIPALEGASFRATDSSESPGVFEREDDVDAMKEKLKALGKR